MADFTAGAQNFPTTKTAYSTGNADVDARIQQLVADWGCHHSGEYIQEMIMTVLKMGHDGISVGDLKLFNRSMKELRYAARTFAPYSKIRKVVAFGSARTPQDAPEAIAAEEFGRKIAEHHFMMITGGGEGIMGAAQRGAGRDRSFGLNIRLPFEQHANETIDGDRKLINFNYFFTRKLNFVKEAHAVALFPGGFGTMDEGFEVLTLMQTGKSRIIPVVLVDKPGGTYWKTWFNFLGDYLLKIGLVSADDFNLFKFTETVDDAIQEITHFYKNFHSYRWVGQRLVIRLNQSLTPQAVDDLNARFSNLLKKDPIIQGTALTAEQNEPDLIQLPRLILTPFRDNFGRLRRLIDAVNEAETQSST